MVFMKESIKKILFKIKSLISSLWLHKKGKKVWIPAVGVLLIILISAFGGGSNAETYTYTVSPKEFVQSVSLTGKVIAAKNVDMGFEASGRVGKVYVQVGDRVKAGAILASIENGDYGASLQKNYALAAAEDARLRNLKSGSTAEDIASAQDDLINAQSDLALAKQTFTDQLRDMYAKADDAIRFKLDNAFKNPRGANPEFGYSVDQNVALKNSLSDQRLKIGEMLVEWSRITSVDDLSTVRTYIAQTQKLINDANTAISIVSERLTPSDLSYADVQARKTDISSARTSFSLAITALNQAETVYKNSLNAVVKAENVLTIKKAGPTQEAVDIQRANLQSAQAGISNAQALINKTLIRAPFEGVITKVDIKAGEIASPNTPVISLLNDGQYQIETYVSENDIAKLKVGQVAKVTLDAYGRDVYFDARVISVDPAETLKDGVSTYRTKIQFVGKDDRVKSGLTANIEIETDRRSDVLQMPQAGLFLEKGVKKVYVLKDTSCIEGATATPVVSPKCSEVLDKKKDISIVDIKTGEINNSGDIELLGGVSAGDVIIYSPKTTK